MTTSGPIALTEASSEAGFVAADAPSRTVELMLVGGITIVLFPLAWLLRAGLGLEASELAVGFIAFHAAYVINDPHFAVTYLLFYKDARRRARRRSFLDAAFVPHAKGGGPIDDLGETPFFAAIFVFVNVHHYFMDTVIWRRENPETRYLGGAP